MFRRKGTARLVATALAVLLPGSLYATNGYFAHGYGTQYKMLAGAGVALHLSTLSPATNPASMVFIGHRYDLGLAIFNPNREYSIDGAPSGFPGTFGLTPGTVESSSTVFPIPNFGANWVLNDRSTFGVALYGNGGMNTDYHRPTFGVSPAGVDLSQMFVAPTYAVKLADRHAVGVSGIFAYQRFRAQGLEAFAGFSRDPGMLSDNGYESSFGYGARVGYLGELTPYLSVGASYQSKIFMSELEKYAGLFAGNGGFDIPPSFTVGVAVEPADSLTLAFDVQRTNYNEIRSVGNPMMPNLMSAPLGASDGPGFGWQDVTAYKLGAEWRMDPTWTLRGGYSYADQPIPSSEVLFNILAPGVMKHHVTAGVSRSVGAGREIHFAVMRAFRSRVDGPNPLEMPGAQLITLEMDQWELEVGYSFGF